MTTTSLQRFFFRSLLIIILTCGASLQAGEFEGTFKAGADGKAPPNLYTIKKIDADKYTVTTNDWVSTVYYDKQEDIYKGVFRFKDFPHVEGNEFTKGGTKENAVGFHLYKILDDGGIQITFQWGRSARDGQGSFKLERVK